MRYHKILAVILSAALFFTGASVNQSAVLASDNVKDGYTGLTAVLPEDLPDSVKRMETVERSGDGYFAKLEEGKYYISDEESQNKYYGHSLYGSVTDQNVKADAFGRLLGLQMDRYLSGEDSCVTITDGVPSDVNSIYELKSSVTFDLSEYVSQLSITRDTTSYELLDMLAIAISSQKNLAALFSYFLVDLSVLGDDIVAYKMTVYSPVQKSDFVSVTNEYLNKLAEIESVPNSDTSMSDEEKVWYVYEQLATLSEYAEDYNMDKAICHTAIGTVLEHESVCQGYAIAFGHIASDIGLDVEYLINDVHAWNAVKIDDSWYYTDATWGDPVMIGGIKDIDMVNHEYLLAKHSDFTDSHDMLFSDTYNNNLYGQIVSNMGNAFDSFFPKVNGVDKAYAYLDGDWYYSDGNHVYRWNMVTGAAVRMEDIESGISCGVYDNTLYYADGNGIYRYNPAGDDEMLAAAEVSSMTIRSNFIYYIENGITKTLELQKMVLPDDNTGDNTVDTPEDNTGDNTVDTPEDNTGDNTVDTPDDDTGDNTVDIPDDDTGDNTVDISDDNTEDSTGDAPVDNPEDNNPEDVKEPVTDAGNTGNIGGTNNSGNTVNVIIADKNILIVSDNDQDNIDVDAVKIKKVKAGKRRMSITWRALKGVDGYQVQYSANRKFASGKKILLSARQKKKVIKKLKKNKIYYVRIRAYRIDSSGKKVYGEYSGTKKCRIR